MTTSDGFASRALPDAATLAPRDAAVDERMLAELMNQMYWAGPAQAEHQANAAQSDAAPSLGGRPAAMPQRPGPVGSSGEFASQFEAFSRQGGMQAMPLLGKPERRSSLDCAQFYWLEDKELAGAAPYSPYWMPKEAAAGSGPAARHLPRPSSSFDVDAVRKDFPVLRQRVHGKPLRTG